MKKLIFLVSFALIVLGTGIWVNSFYYTFQEYEEYCETIRTQELGIPIPYYNWDGGRYVNITLIALFFLWMPFLDYFLQKKAYPFLRQKITYRGTKRFSRSTSRSLYERLYRLVFGYFTRINRKVGAKNVFWAMKMETFEHTQLLTKVLKRIVLPSIILYVFTVVYFFQQNPLDSILIAILLFFYSNFVPDLPAIFRRKVYRDVRDTSQKDLPWYKTYALLLFAPFFIILVFCGIKIKWKTTKTFHNFKSLAIYGVFLFILSFLVFADFPTSIGDITEIISVPIFALLGYLTHLKVDLIF